MTRQAWMQVVVLLIMPGFARADPPEVGPVAVDEPLGARYSLGMTLWHLGHNAAMIDRFHEYVKQQGLMPARLLPSSALEPPATVTRLLIEPERLGNDKLGGWSASDDCITSGAGDSGPTTSIPVSVPQAGLYRVWVGYVGYPAATGVTFLKIYRHGQEAEGPICQADEICDMPTKDGGYAWHDMLVDLPAGDLVIKFGHVTRWWHGGGGYGERRIDCLYITDEVWAAPPDAAARQAMRDLSAPTGIQWTATPALTDTSSWQWWQVRPRSWEDRDSHERLFALSRQFHRSIIDELADKSYDEKTLPDYRSPERQVVFEETWNMVANPVRAKRQIDVLSADVSPQPLDYHYVWHDVASNIAGLRADGMYANTPHAAYGGWYGQPGALLAGYGEGSGTVTTSVPVKQPGKYAVWVLSDGVNVSYTAPWFGKVSAGGVDQFTYHHQGTIPTVWMKMGEVTLQKPGKVTVAFILDGAGAGGTDRRIYTLFLVDDLAFTPQGTVRPPWTLDMYRERATQAGAQPSDKLLLWLSENPFRPLSQEVWADKVTTGDGWPEKPVLQTTQKRSLLMARETDRAVQVGLRNLTDSPLTLDVDAGPLQGTAGDFPGKLRWRVEAFVPYGSDRQEWTPFFLMRRPNVTVPPFGVAGVWLSVDTHGVPAGRYKADVTFRGEDMPVHTVQVNVRVADVTPHPRQPVLVDGYTGPHEGEAYLKDFVEHGMNVWPGEMSKADMRKWGIRLLHLGYHSTEGIPAWLERLKALNLDYEDYFVAIMDEPSGTTEQDLKPYLDVAKAIRAADPKVRISFNPAEAAELTTFQLLAPYGDFWVPYTRHVFTSNWGNPEKWKLFHPQPWMWYSTPCLWDKTAREPGIRTVPSQPGDCVGVAFFALNYPWRDQWDTAYEHISDASTMGAVMSRHGPVATIVWEQMREAKQAADLAMMVRERLGAKSFDEVTDPALQSLIREGSSEQLILWLLKER